MQAGETPTATGLEALEIGFAVARTPVDPGRNIRYRPAGSIEYNEPWVGMARAGCRRA